MAIDYIICAAGAGSRMVDVNPRLPKPLIRLGGRSLLERSLDSLDLFPGDRLILITQARHAIRSATERLLHNRFPGIEINWIEIDRLTRGQLETAMMAESYFSPDRGIVIFNCDTYFRSRGLQPLLHRSDVDGVIPCSLEPGDAWSFCRIQKDEGGRPAGDLVVDLVTEKDRISDWCSVGFYYFRDAKRFARAAREAMESPAKVELFVAPLYNRLIQDGAKILVDKVETFLPMGSLAQLQAYWKADIDGLREENPRGTVVVDLDGTLTRDEPGIPYPDKRPREDVIERVRGLRNEGFDIVIQTARRMKTHGGDESAAIADIGQVTLEWLERHKVPFSRIRFGKPFADQAFYLDDRAIRPSELLRMTTQEALEIILREQEAGLPE